MQGWIKLHRNIQANWIWTEKPFDKRSAWIDILLMANHKDNKFLLGNELVEVEAGSFITSEIKLMERWGWSKSKVRNFLKVLENDSMIVKKTDHKKTTLTVVKYRDYQVSETTEEPQKDHEKTTKEPQKDTNKNDKNVNNEKKDIYKELFDYYISLGIIKHKQLTKDHIKAIDLAIKQNNYSIEDMKLLLNRHKQVIELTKNNQYPVRPRTLSEFFGQKIQGATSLICTQYDVGGKYYIENKTEANQVTKQAQYRRFDLSD